jgi:hypothetical protein
MPTPYFKKGQKKPVGSGMKKGQKTKFTTLKQAFIDTFQELGGKEYLLAFAKGDNKKKIAFVKAISSMLPRDVQLSGADGAPLPSQVPVIIFQDAPIQESKSDDKK